MSIQPIPTTIRAGCSTSQHRGHSRHALLTPDLLNSQGRFMEHLPDSIRFFCSANTDVGTSGYEEASHRIPNRRKAYRLRLCVGYAPPLYPMPTANLPDTELVRTCLSTDTCSFVQSCFRGPAYVSYRRSASYSTAGEWLRPFEPRKGKRQQRQ